MKILVTGSNGQLGKEFNQIKDSFSHEFLFSNTDNLNICSRESINSFLKNKNIDCIINCAAYTDVEKAEYEKEKAYEVNCNGVENLVIYCEKNNVKLIHFSTDYVYNSNSLNPISEEECINPQNYYGLTKRMGEKHVEYSKSESIVIRTSWLYSKHGKNFVNTIIEKSYKQKEIKVIFDQYGCPTYAKDLAIDVLKILNNKNKLDYKGKIFNYSNIGATNWADFAKKIIELNGTKNIIKSVKSNYFKSAVKRPKFAVTNKSKIYKAFNLNINYWDISLNNYITKDLK